VRDKNLTATQNKFLSKWYKFSPQTRAQILKEVTSYKGEAVKYYATLEKADKIFNDSNDFV
jgi:hypothetical protein